MDTNKILSSLCYFSIFFASFLFPIIVYFVVADKEVKHHAKAALLSHILPFLTIIGAVVIGITSGLLGGEPTVLFILIIVVVMAVNLFVFVWNIIKGVKVLL